MGAEEGLAHNEKAEEMVIPFCYTNYFVSSLGVHVYINCCWATDSFIGVHMYIVF